MTEPQITQWIHGVKQGDAGSEQALWNHYFARVVRLAQSRMFALQGTVYDEEDAAASAIRSFFRGVRTDRFPDLRDRDNLWRLLVLITQRKLRAQWRRESAGIRCENLILTIEDVIGDEPTPDFVAQMMDQTQRLLALLDDDVLRRIAVMRMDGLTNDEIAKLLGCASRTVQRKMERIRNIWGEHDV